MPFQEEVRVPYRGSYRKLLLSFDVGVASSRVSYSILDPGEVPVIRSVSRFPGQKHVGGGSTVPSILYYDRQGAVMAVGSEALKEHIMEIAEDEEWIKVEWWMLHLRPLSSRDHLPLLPEGKSAVQILADFIRYLFNCVRIYIIETHPSGDSLWNSVEKRIEFILTYPNGWEESQWQQFRCAVQIAKLVPGADEQLVTSQIHLLAEGEAIFRFCVHELASNPIPTIHLAASSNDLEDGAVEVSYHQGIVVIFVKEDTIDLSIYSVRPTLPIELKEIAPAECARLQGSVFVTQRARAYLRTKLANSRYGSPDVIEQMTEIFDKTARLRFRDASKAEYIKFGTVRDKDNEHDIRSGQLKLSGGDVAKFFEPSVEAIADAFEKQRQVAAKLRISIKHGFLVGSFAASDFLYRSLQTHPVFSEVVIYRPSEINNVVVDGALRSLIDQFAPSPFLHPG